MVGKVFVCSKVVGISRVVGASWPSVVLGIDIKHWYISTCLTVLRLAIDHDRTYIATTFEMPTTFEHIYGQFSYHLWQKPKIATRLPSSIYRCEVFRHPAEYLRCDHVHFWKLLPLSNTWKTCMPTCICMPTTFCQKPSVFKSAMTSCSGHTCIWHTWCTHACLYNCLCTEDGSIPS